MKIWVATAAAVLAAALVGAPAAMAQVAFPQTPVGASASNQDVVIVNDDPEFPVTLGQATVSGPDAAAFPAAADTCTGKTLASGDECTVTVGFTSARVGTHTATLHVPVEGEPDAPFSAAVRRGHPVAACHPVAARLRHGAPLPPQHEGCVGGERLRLAGGDARGGQRAERLRSRLR